MSVGREQLLEAWRRLLASIGSGTALLPESIVWMVVAGTISAVGAQSRLFESPETAFYGFLTAILSTSMMALLVIVHRLIVRDLRFLASAPALIVAFAVYGGLRLLLLAMLQQAVGLPTLYAGSARLWAGACQGLVWLSLTSLYFASRDQFMSERSRLLDEQAQLEMRARRQSALSRAIARELADTVGDRLQASVQRSRALITASLDLDNSEQALRRVATSLREAIDRDIRPISHELWAEAPSDQVRMSLSMLLRIGCYPRPYPIAMALTIGCLFAGPMALSMPHPGWALLMFCVQIGSSGVALFVADRIVRAPGVPDPATYWAGLFAASLMSAVPPFVMPSLGWTATDAIYWAGFCSVGTAALLVCTAIVTGLAGTRTKVLSSALASLSKAEVAQRVRARDLAEASRLLARHLHSSLQGRLMAITLELERAADLNNREVAMEALHRLDGLLETPLLGALEPESVQLDAGLSTLVREWSSIVDVTLSLDVADSADCSRGELILGIAEEAIANAVRHAHAQSIDIRVWQTGDVITVRVENDGTVHERGLAGLGSRWLDAVSPESWMLEPDPGSGHMVLQVRLPSMQAEAHA